MPKLPMKRLSLLLLICLTGCRSLSTQFPTAETMTPPASGTAVLPQPEENETAVAGIPLPATYTPRPNPSATWTPSPTPTPTPTPTPSHTPTPTNTPFPYPALSEQLPTPETAVPTPVPTFAVPNNVTLIALLGNDGDGLDDGRTDSIILVAINKQAKTATMLSLPRDLYVPIPGWQMARLNQAMPRGFGSNYPGLGRGLLNDTLLWSFGVPVHNYVRIGFSGFKQAIDILGGIEVPVTCALRDWRLISPELDPNVEENWQQFTLEPGVHQMDGDLALWYARSRRTTSDFERGRRQQQLVHAMLNKGLNRDLIAQIPALWEAYRQSVQTDLSLAQVLELAAIAPQVRENGIRHLTLPYNAFTSWQVPSTGAAVQLINWPAAEPVFNQLLYPSELNRGTRPLRVEVVSNSYEKYLLAAENLAWFGIIPIYTPNPEPDPPNTRIDLHAPNDKGTFSWIVAWVFNQSTAQINLLGSDGSPYLYTVQLGEDFDPCRPLLAAPRG